MTDTGRVLQRELQALEFPRIVDENNSRMSELDPSSCSWKKKRKSAFQDLFVDYTDMSQAEIAPVAAFILNISGHKPPEGVP